MFINVFFLGTRAILVSFANCCRPYVISLNWWYYMLFHPLWFKQLISDTLPIDFTPNVKNSFKLTVEGNRTLNNAVLSIYFIAISFIRVPKVTPNSLWMKYFRLSFNERWLLNVCVDAVLLQNVQTLTLYRGRYTTARRSSPVPQLQCVGGSAGCHAFVPEVVQCQNRGWDGVDVQVRWGFVTDFF